MPEELLNQLQRDTGTDEMARVGVAQIVGAEDNDLNPEAGGGEQLDEPALLGVQFLGLSVEGGVQISDGAFLEKRVAIVYRPQF